MRQKIKKAVIVNENVIRPILLSEQTYNAPRKERKTLPNIFKPIFVCSFLLLISLLIFSIEKRNKQHAYWFDAIVYSIAGIAGVVIAYLMFLSDHPLVANNWNLLWTNPLNLIFGITVLKKSIRKYLIYYQYLNCILLVVALLLFITKVQILNIAFMPLITLLLIRTILFIGNNKKSITE